MKHTTTLIILSMLCPLAASAQLHPTQQKSGYVKTLFSDTDSVAVYDALMANAPSEFGSHVPRFAVIGKDRSFYIGLGGMVKAIVSYDFGNTMDHANEFYTSHIPFSRRPGDGGRIQFSAQQTALFLNFVGLPGSDNEIGAFIGANLLGDGYAPALQYAYIRYRGIKAGYDKTLFSDPAAVPPSIDYEGVSSSCAIGNALVNYTCTFGKKKEWSAGVGIELPMYSATDAAALGTENPGAAYTVTQRVPDIPAFIQWSWADGSSWLRASAIVRNLLYHNPMADKNVDKVGWGVQLSGTASITPWPTAYYQGVYGKGVASYIQDLCDGGMDLLPSASNLSVLNTVKTWGAYGALQFNICPSVFASASYSHVRNYVDGNVFDFDGYQYRYAQYVGANVFWDINNVLQAGVEYIYGRRIGASHAQQGHDNRIQASLQLSF